MLITDMRGLPLTTSHAAAVAHFDTTIQRYLEYRLDTVDHLRQTLQANPSLSWITASRDTSLCWPVRRQ